MNIADGQSLSKEYRRIDLISFERDPVREITFDNERTATIVVSRCFVCLFELIVNKMNIRMYRIKQEYYDGRLSATANRHSNSNRTNHELPDV
jgi:hypothetical protein